MSGERNLQMRLAALEPELHEEIYVFATTTDAATAESVNAMLRFVEAEGTTLVLPQTAAEAAGLPYEFPCRMITLKVQSTMETIGFLAAVTSRLAELEIGVNPVSGFYHNHLFVPAARAEEALAALQDLAG